MTPAHAEGETSGGGDAKADGAGSAGGAGLPKVCAVCSALGAKYRCPACDRRTCSLACVKQHKEDYECTGKRPRAEFVAPLRAFTDHLVERDFGFLEEVDCAADRADREYHHLADRLKLFHQSWHRTRLALARACALRERRVRLIFAPRGLALARSNTTRLSGTWPGRKAGKKGGKGKGKGKWKGKDSGKGSSAQMGDKPLLVAWRVEWHFGKVGQVLTDPVWSENEYVGTSVARFLENKWTMGATRHLLMPYVEAGLDQLSVFLHLPTDPTPALAEAEEGSDEEHDDETAPPSRAAEPAVGQAEGYRLLDKEKSLRENLADSTILEFPVIHVALPCEADRFRAEATSEANVATGPETVSDLAPLADGSPSRESGDDGASECPSDYSLGRISV